MPEEKGAHTGGERRETPVKGEQPSTRHHTAQDTAQDQAEAVPASSAGQGTAAAGDGDVYDAAESVIIAERLEALGYIE
jgi:hypothetical protein